MRALLRVLPCLMALSGCGVEPQPTPEPLRIPVPEVSQPQVRSGDAGLEITVFFVRGADLAPVGRTVEARTSTEALELLTTGPTRAEVISGLRTALAPQPLTVDEGLPGGITSVAVTPEFAGVTGPNQLLAVAQVVWTLTDLDETSEVRFLVEGDPVEVPTDGGLTEQPVGRDHFASVAPRPDAD